MLNNTAWVKHRVALQRHSLNVRSNLNALLLGGLCLSLLSACTTTPPEKVAPLSVRDLPGITSIPTEQLPKLFMGQTIYVPVYSEVYSFDEKRTLLLLATLSLRNTDLSSPIVIETVDYYDSGGKKIRSYLSTPIQLAPLASVEVVVPKDDRAGGAGANFIIDWRSEKTVSEPIMEAIMINTLSQQGISFVGQGRVIQERGQK